MFEILSVESMRTCLLICVTPSEGPVQVECTGSCVNFVSRVFESMLVSVCFPVRRACAG